MNEIIVSWGPIVKEYLAPFLNTILLVILFIYQRNKNKILVDRLNSQECILKDTNELVNKQSQLIENHHKISDSAMRYAESFDPDKLKKVIEQEIKTKYENEIKNIERNYSGEISDLEEKNKKLKELMQRQVKDALDLSDKYHEEYMHAYLGSHIEAFARAVDIDIEARNEILSKMPEWMFDAYKNAYDVIDSKGMEISKRNVPQKGD